MVLVSIYDDIKMWFSLEIRIWSPLESQRLSPNEKPRSFLLDHAGQGRGRRKGRVPSSDQCPEGQA